MGIGFCWTCAIVTGTAACCPLPRPPCCGGETASPPAEQAAAASAAPSANERVHRTRKRCMPLFKTESLDRIQRGRFASRIEPKEDTGRRRKAEGERHRVGRHGSRPPLPKRDALGEREAQGNPDAAAKEAEHDGFDEKLQQHVAAASADRHAQADLARAL